MINILFIQPYASNLGGVDSVLLQLVGGLDRTRYRPFVLMTAPTVYVEKYEKLGCKVLFGPIAVFGKPTDPWYYFRNGAKLIRSLGAIRRIVREHRIDLIHTHKMEVLGPNIVGKRLGIPTIQTVHELPRRPLAGYRFIGWLNHLFNDRVIVLCERSKPMFRWFGRESGKLVKIYNGIGAPTGFETSSQASSLRERLGASDGDWIVIAVARLSPEKGLEYLIDAAALVKTERADVKFAIVGDVTFGHEQAYKESLAARIRRLGLEDTVHMLGLRRDVPDLLRQSDVFALTSVSDTFPTAVLEAMSAGLPVVATDVGGVPEMVRADSGIVVPSRDARALKDAFLRMFREDCKSMGRAGQALFLREFTRDEHVAKTTKLYEEVLSGKANRAAVLARADR